MCPPGHHVMQLERHAYGEGVRLHGAVGCCSAIGDVCCRCRAQLLGHTERASNRRGHGGDHTGRRCHHYRHHRPQSCPLRRPPWSTLGLGARRRPWLALKLILLKACPTAAGSCQLLRRRLLCLLSPPVPPSFRAALLAESARESACRVLLRM